MSSINEQTDFKDLAEKIQQFFSHQLESNNSLDDGAKECLTVATECIEQAYNFQRKPASRELLDAYKAYKSPPNSQSNSGSQTTSNSNQVPQPDPTEMITNIASSLLSRVGSSFVGAAANAASAAASQQTTATSTNAQQTQQPNVQRKTRKNASDAEKMAAESFKNQGNDFMRQDKFKEAYDSYTKAIEIDNNNAVYYCNRAAASSKLEKHQDAIDDCLEATEIDPNYSKAYGRLGLAYATLDNHLKAREAYVKAVELDPSNQSYLNNLQIAEAKIAESQNAGRDTSGTGDSNVVNMLRSMMSNPEVMSMAMRSLQDPRVQSMFGLGGQNQNPSQPR